MRSSHYDIIICGAGCSGLSLLMHLIESKVTFQKKILLVDQFLKNKNDRTWCFWEKEDGLFQPIVYKEWKQLWFQSNWFSGPLHIQPYTYKLIRGIDFYEYCFQRIKACPEIEFCQGSVKQVVSTEKETYAVIDQTKVTANFIFNSVLFEKPQLKANEYWLLQHFKGWVIEAATPAFNPGAATLMDFTTDQSLGTTFFYVLPFTENKALVEYTLFYRNILADEVYEKELMNYVKNKLQVTEYTILEKEFGVIPMTNYVFPWQQHNLLHIGTAGGQTKASSGYTFRFIQKQSAAIVKGFVQKNNPSAYLSIARRFSFYDSVLLHILNYNRLPGSEIFSQLFEANKADKIFKFLDNETSFIEELPILKSLPFFTFTQAAIRQMLG